MAETLGWFAPTLICVVILATYAARFVAFIAESDWLWGSLFALTGGRLGIVWFMLIASAAAVLAFLAEAINCLNWFVGA